MSKRTKQSVKEIENPQVEEVNPSNSQESLILITSVILAGLLTTGAFILGYLTRQWQFFAITAVMGVALLSGLFTVFHLWETKTEARGFAFLVFTEIAFIVSSMVLSSAVSLGIAVIALAFAVIFGSTELKGRYVELSILVGLIVAVMSALVGNLTIVDQVSNATITLGIFIAAGSLIFILLIQFIFGWITASIRVKLLLAGLVVTLVPLAILSVISNRYTQNAIQAQSNQSLSIAAEQTATSINEFFSSNLDSVQTETTLPAIQRYLSLNSNERSGSVEETELRTTFTSLQTKQKLYLPSYGLLDTSGLNLFDTDTSLILRSEAETEYFKTVLNTGLPYSSEVFFPADTRDAYLIFISPIKNVSNQTIGYLRTRYDALLLQTIIQANVGLIGSRSYPMLLDENGLRLADGYSPNLIYHSLTPMDLETYQALILAERLPSYISHESLSTNQADLAQNLQQTKVEISSP